MALPVSLGGAKIYFKRDELNRTGSHKINNALGQILLAMRMGKAREGIIPALEPAHALAWVGEIAKALGKDKIVVMNLCGRGDKDIFTVAGALGASIR